MDAIIVPSRIVINIGDDGKVKEAVLQYKVRLADGAVDQRYRTMAVHKGISDKVIQEVLEQSISRAKEGEGTNLVKRRETEAEIKNRIKENLKNKGGAK